MENFEIYLQEIMRNVASALMLPVMIVLVLLILFSVYSVGALIAEFVVERRHFKANMPRDIKAIKDSSFQDLPKVIESTGLLRKQKTALQVIAANMGLPEDDLFALAKSEVSATDARYRRKVSRTELVTKIAPMMGLMCTLIPLGPGIVAMGQGEVNILSNSLLVAFDGTVAGLIGGVVSMCVSSVRKRWYAQYLVAMEALTTCVLEKADEARKQGIKLPYEGDVRARAEAYRSGAAKKTGLKPADKKTFADTSAKPAETDQYLKDYSAAAATRSTAPQSVQETPAARPAPSSRSNRETTVFQQVPVAQLSWDNEPGQSTLPAQLAREMAATQSASVVQPVREVTAVQSATISQPSWKSNTAQTLPELQPSSETAAVQSAPIFQPVRETAAAQSMPVFSSGWDTASAQPTPAFQLDRDAQASYPPDAQAACPPDAQAACPPDAQAAYPPCHSERREESPRSGLPGSPLRGDPSPSAQDDKGAATRQAATAQSASAFWSSWGTAARQEAHAAQTSQVAAAGQSTPLSQSGWGVRR